MFWTIDRIEDGVAVLLSEDGQAVSLPAELLPDGTGEGDWGRLAGKIFMPDVVETQKRRQQLKGLLEDLLQ
ncbi:MAG: hypothetical protein PWQ08_710 [Clostridiales bacterium]|jgi:hypothetical protein|nr:DUF3006 domain-containing protein [Pygmaiobacter sp.]MDK2813455.1 hypothetical protein [Clostridiales bacterium]